MLGGSVLSFAASLQRPVTVSRNPQEAHRRRLTGSALDAGGEPLVLDRLPNLLTNDFQLGSSGRVVAYAREAEEITWKLRATRMEDECSAHSKDSAEEARFEDHVVSRRSLAGSCGIGCGWAIRRPVVAREQERGEIDFTRHVVVRDACRDT